MQTLAWSLNHCAYCPWAPSDSATSESQSLSLPPILPPSLPLSHLLSCTSFCISHASLRIILPFTTPVFFSLLILEDLPSSLATCRNCPDSHFVTVQGLFVSWQGELLTLQRSVAGSLWEQTGQCQCSQKLLHGAALQAQPGWNVGSF